MKKSCHTAGFFLCDREKEEMKLTKIIILCILMILPIGVIVFISGFGKNKYTLPVFFAEDSILIKGDKYEVTKAFIVPNFDLIDQDGKPITQKQLRGNIYVADFFFTRCGSICPKMSTQLTRLQAEFEKDTIVKIVSFTVDPKHDSVEVLKQYAADYNAMPGKWRFATGPKEAIYKLGQEGYFLSTMADAAHPVDFIHSDKLILVDKKGWIRGYYNGTDLKEVDKLITEIRVLQQIYADESIGK
jgi:protein SCO1/2